ncbi:MAG: hypothetical protein JSS56_02415 [Proteobacteria bacterium]|nr:hypothetical protein [Pseudomonadota bacterium]
MNDDPLQRLVDGWLAYHRAAETAESGVVKVSASDELFQFVIEVDDLVRTDPERAWLVIQMIFTASRNDLERACLAAGPLEDLLVKHGPLFIEKIEQAASSSSDFRELLVGVWRNGIAHAIWERIQRAAGTA